MSALLHHIAVVIAAPSISAPMAAKSVAAVQKQVTRDFTPVWGVAATVDFFLTVEDVPLDYWMIIVSPEPGSEGGYHTDENGQPYAIVDSRGAWTQTLSHECLELLADPFGNRTVAGKPPRQALPPLCELPRVNYLVEVCDPCEHPAYAYAINGVQVSDFVTPEYYSPLQRGRGLFSFCGHVAEPHQILEGCYVTFSDPLAERW